MEVSMAKKIAFLGLMSALALIFSYVEAIIPFNLGIPGAKLGLANLVVVTALYLFSVKEALLIDIVKILVSSLLFGSALSLMYSLSGGLISFAVMVSVKKYCRLSVTGVSILGGVSHNIGQLAVAILVTETLRLSYYLPILLVAGLVTGFLIGLVSDRLIPLLGKAITK
jgi:heptaprenyl diphosphate synthase